MIPVQRPYLGEEELRAVGEVFDSRWLTMGSITQEFESQLSEFLGAKHVIAVNTGTSALHIALDALGIGKGDEVVVPSLTYVATIQAIVATGARPVFCDVDIQTLNSRASDINSRLTPRTRAVMPVHYGGLPCEMDEIMAIARRHGVWVVEDAAHAFGSKYKGQLVGNLGHVTCFSFDHVKNITCGDGGAVVTNIDELAASVSSKRILGISNETSFRYRGERNWHFEVVTQGYRYHMTNISAAIGLQQLKRLEEFKTWKQEIVRLYDEAFCEIDGIELLERNLPESFPFCYVIRVTEGKRDALMSFLKARGVGSGVHYIPNHLQPFFRPFKVPLPVTEQVFTEIITLPLYYDMNEDDINEVISAVHSFFGG